MSQTDDITTAPAAAADDADRALKARHRTMWALGDYPRMARDFLPPLGERLADAADVVPGQRVLDVGAGTGNAAIAAARRGARVVASDLTPELFDDGRELARQRGVTLEWLQGDAEALPVSTGAFDAVISCIGAMFAPHHEATAAELLRACRPGGTVAMINWTPEGLIGDLFRRWRRSCRRRRQARPRRRAGAARTTSGRSSATASRPGDDARGAPRGVSGRRRSTTALLQEQLRADDHRLQNVSDDPDRTAQLDAQLAGLFERANLAPGGAPARYVFEYLVIAARRAPQR